MPSRVCPSMKLTQRLDLTKSKPTIYLCQGFLSKVWIVVINGLAAQTPPSYSSITIEAWLNRVQSWKLSKRVNLALNHPSILLSKTKLTDSAPTSDHQALDCVLSSERYLDIAASPGQS
ncbi:hypothetical protein Tco_0186118 [Tanacetum coccineum]